MCGSSHSSSTNDQQGLSKLAGISPPGKTYGAFKIGDRASGRTARGDETSKRTGEIVDFLQIDRGIAVLRLDSGEQRNVWSDTLKLETPEFKVGDRVTGSENDGVTVAGSIIRIDSKGEDSLGVELRLDTPHRHRDTWWVKYSSLQRVVTEFKVGDYVTGNDDPEDDGDSYTGEITAIHSKDGQNVVLRDTDNDTVWVYYSSLVAAERPGLPAPVVVEAGPALTATVAPEPVAPKYPVNGSVDFNKELFGENENLTEINVISHVPGADYPFVVSFRGGYGGVQVGTYDADGDHATDSDYNLRNAFELPDLVFIVIYRDTDNDDQLGVLDEVFDSEESAKVAHLDESYSLVGILPVHPKELDAKRIADLAAEAAAVASGDDGEGDDTSSDDTSDASGGLSEISLYVSGRYTTLRPGQTIFAKRRGFGVREGKIVKIRSHSNKQILFQPNDGSSRYYALNKNLQTSRY